MVARTVKIMGSAYSTGTTVTVDFEYNGNIVCSGPVPTIVQNPVPAAQPDTSDNWEQELGTFVTDTDITGQIPCKITVTGGTVFFAHMWMNYTGNVIVTPNYPVTPVPPMEFLSDTDITVTPVPPIEYFSDPSINTVETDGVSNTRKNGQTWTWRTNVADQTGDWAYPVQDSEIFTFDFFVDPACVVTEPYEPYVPPV